MNSILSFIKLFLITMIFGTHLAEANTELENTMLDSYSDSLIEYKAPSIKDLDKACELFKTVLKAKGQRLDLLKAWQNIGLKLSYIQEKNQTYAVISECDGKTGHGLYVIKMNNDSSHVLQAPHRPSDKLTHKIIFQLFTEGNYAAAAWNNIGRHVIDLGKESRSYYNAFSKAISLTYQKPVIVQLHAFDGAVHEIDDDMILSAAKSSAPLWLSAAGNCLRDNIADFKLLVYPTDIHELGGTLNINAENFYQNNINGHFYHVETSKIFRKTMLADKKLRNQLSQCLIGNR